MRRFVIKCNNNINNKNVTPFLWNDHGTSSQSKNVVLKIDYAFSCGWHFIDKLVSVIISPFNIVSKFMLDCLQCRSLEYNLYIFQPNNTPKNSKINIGGKDTIGNL